MEDFSIWVDLEVMWNFWLRLCFDTFVQTKKEKNCRDDHDIQWPTIMRKMQVDLQNHLSLVYTANKHFTVCSVKIGQIEDMI